MEPGDPGTRTAACHRLPYLCGHPVAHCQFQWWEEPEPARSMRPRGGSWNVVSFPDSALEMAVQHKGGLDGGLPGLRVSFNPSL